LPTKSDCLLFDTSAALAAADPANPHHAMVLAAARGHRLGLAGHAVFEMLSVLTRLPPSSRLSGADALHLIEANFPESRYLEPADAAGLAAEFVAKDIVGGSVWDGLVGAAARAHGLTLLTCDRRAQPTYDALGVAYRLIA
jgi:predicted nucleic acid-binding protein